MRRPAALARLRPLNLYGWSKLAFDRRVAQLLARGAPRPPQWAGLRFFNVYGPNEHHKGRMASVLLHKYRQVMAGRARDAVPLRPRGHRRWRTRRATSSMSTTASR